MKTILLALLCVTLAPFVRAQETKDYPQHVLLYGTYALTHVSSVPNDLDTGLGGTYGVSSSGLGLGVTINLHRFSAVALGLDLRLAYVPHGVSQVNNTDVGKANYELLGVKVAFHNRHTRLVPYAQVSAGGLSASGSSSWAMFEYIGGIDCPIARHFSVRLIEMGGGGATTGQSTNDLDSHTYTSTNVFTVNSGMVARF